MQMFDTDLVEARLKEPEWGFDQVFGAADYAAVTALSDFRPGTAYVVLAGERNPASAGAQPRARASAVASFGVIVVATNFRDQTGKEALNDVKDMVRRLREALIGWAPAGCDHCIWLQGDVMDYDRSNLLWCDVFTTTHVLGGKKS